MNKNIRLDLLVEDGHFVSCSTLGGDGKLLNRHLLAADSDSFSAECREKQGCHSLTRLPALTSDTNLDSQAYF